MLLAFISLSLIHYWRESRLLEDQIRLATIQLGEVMKGSLRHAMLTNDREMLVEIMGDVAEMENIQGLQIVALDGQVKADSRGQEVGKMWRVEDIGCQECHQFPPETRPLAIRLADSPNVLRISMPIPMEPDCAGCHTEDSDLLGTLLADVSLTDVENHFSSDLRIGLLISLLATVVVVLGVHLLVHRLVVRRMAALRGPLAELAAGDFSTRLPISSGPEDDLDRFARNLNQMAEKLERHTHEQEERSKLREQAIIEERERIARELHDGMAQILGYVNTKAMAIRLILKRRQIEAADQHLLQLEQAARELFIDMRGTILGLKISGQDRDGLAADLKSFTAQFGQLSGLQIELVLGPGVDSLSLAAETELQLLRIAQEALSNVHKHASASESQVSLQIDDDILELMVSDNGQGFIPGYASRPHRPHFGLSTMRERAEAIGAEFNIDSKLGTGTCVVVRLPFNDLFRAQSEEG
jgi:signal transduction histidine kinase